jgi:hypothetical protein
MAFLDFSRAFGPRLLSPMCPDRARTTRRSRRRAPELEAVESRISLSTLSLIPSAAAHQPARSPFGDLGGTR